MMLIKNECMLKPLLANTVYEVCITNMVFHVYCIACTLKIQEKCEEMQK